MEKTFSGTVKILDLDDFLKPAEECVVIEKSQTQNNKPEKLGQIYFEDDIRPDLISGNSAKVALDDCLACNGCVTTSETILIQEQSINKFLEIEKNFKRKGLLISSQSRASIAEELKITEKEAHYLLCEFFKQFGIEFVLDLELFVVLVKEMEWQSLNKSESKYIIRKTVIKF